ncbi:MAG: myrcene/ocimene synthase [Sorangium cellulosum]|nr:MAG: myrcene/ocimene synthase [Sorangium cellulosum]
MRLYQGRITTIAVDIVKTLTSAGDIETDAPREVQADVESVLTAYLDAERRIIEETKDVLSARGLSQRDFGRIKKIVAEKVGIPSGNEIIDYLLDQIVAMLMYSHNVEEVYVEDVELRRKMAPILKREMAVDEQLERETRARLGHVQEGTRTWEVEYQRVLGDIRRRKGL